MLGHTGLLSAAMCPPEQTGRGSPGRVSLRHHWDPCFHSLLLQTGKQKSCPSRAAGQGAWGDRVASAPWLRGRLLQSDGGVERMCQAWGLLSFPFRL